LNISGKMTFFVKLGTSNFKLQSLIGKKFIVDSVSTTTTKTTTTTTTRNIYMRYTIKKERKKKEKRIVYSMVNYIAIDEFA